MSLHQRVLYAITIRDTSIVPYHEVNAALRAVVELHAPVKPYRDTPQLDCHGCGQPPMARHRAPWPCSTVQAIARELGVQEDDRG